MKRKIRFFSLILTLTLLGVLAAPLAVIAEFNLPSWTFSDGADIAADPSGAFKYAGYYRASDGAYKTTRGFYDLVKVEGQSYYGLPLTKQDGSMGSINQISLTTVPSNYHADLGFAFTAPYSGEISVTFTNSISNYWNSMGDAGYHVLYITSETCGFERKNVTDITCSGALGVYPTKSVSQTITLQVESGETYYFLHGTSNSATAGWEQNKFVLQSLSYTKLAEQATSAKVIGHGLATVDSPLVRFFVQFDKDASALQAEFSIESENGIQTYVDSGVAWVDETGECGKMITAEDHVFYYTVAVSAKQMTDTITLSIKDLEGNELITQKNTYTVENYCQHWINQYKADGSRYAVAKTCATMLLYGRTTQMALNYRTDRLPSIDVDFLNEILTNGLDPESDAFYGADGTKIPDTSISTDAEGAMNISSSELMSMIRTGTLASNGKYQLAAGESLKFTNDSDSSKTYNLKNATIFFELSDGGSAVVIESVKKLTLKNANLVVKGGNGGVLATSTRELSVSDIHVSGNTGYGFSFSGEETVLDGCIISPSDGGKIDVGVITGVTDQIITNCNFKSLGKGIVDQSQTGALIENNRLSQCDVAISVETANTIVQRNTIRGGEIGVKASFAKSEISAAQSKGYNILVAKNVFSDTAVSVMYENASNSVILFNRAENISATGCTNLYVAENTVSNTLTLKNNNYMLANKNVALSLVSEQNENMNGDNVTDLNARNDVGSNESLLPHINAECFAGMNKKNVKTLEGSQRLNVFLTEQLASEDVVIVPPGAYFSDSVKFSDLRNKKIYAYGVLNEKADPKTTAVALENCVDVALHGMFFNNTIYPNLQGTITEVKASSNTLTFKVDPGYPEDYSDYGKFYSNSFGYVYRNGELYPVANVAFLGTATRSYDPITHSNTVTGIYTPMGILQVGDRIVFRTGNGANAVQVKSGSGVLLEDVTVFSSTGFAESDKNCDVAPVLHRYAVTFGPAPILDSTKDYSSYTNVTWTDSYGRLRSASPLNTSCDATHCTDARVGVQMISCLAEGMNDDGGNVNGMYGIASSYDAVSKKLTYTYCDVNSYQMVPAAFRKGDTARMFTSSGELIAIVTTESATVDNGDRTFSIQVSADVDLKGHTDVIIQNMSACGDGFLMDNVVVRDSAVRGILIKCTSGEIKNCTFQNLGASAILYSPEYKTWPEVGPPSNIKIHHNKFDSVGTLLRQYGDTSRDRIAIQISGYEKTSDVAYCLNQNIEITDNVFVGNYNQTQIGLSCVKDVKICNNTFLPRHGTTDTTDNGTPIAIFGGNGIEISGNVFPASNKTPIYIEAGKVENVTIT